MTAVALEGLDGSMINDRAQAKCSGENPTGASDMPALLGRVKTGDEDAIAELFRILCSGLRLLIRRRLGSEGAEDCLRETFQAVVEGIRTDGLRDPASLMAFVRETLQRRLASEGETSRVRVAATECGTTSVVAIREMLQGLPEQERDALTRFYVLEQPAEQVIGELRLSAADFRAMKARAKMRFLEIRRNFDAEPGN